MRTPEQLPECPVAIFVQIMGSKWKLMIIRDLLDGETFFGQLKRDLGGISHKVLAENLRELERDGIISRTVYDEVPKRVSYSMTDFGMSLSPIYESVAAWGEFYRSEAKKVDRMDPLC